MNPSIYLSRKDGERAVSGNKWKEHSKRQWRREGIHKEEKRWSSGREEMKQRQIRDGANDMPYLIQHYVTKKGQESIRFSRKSLS